jgi:hypothetical protein
MEPRSFVVLLNSSHSAKLLISSLLDGGVVLFALNRGRGVGWTIFVALALIAGTAGYIVLRWRRSPRAFKSHDRSVVRQLRRRRDRRSVDRPSHRSTVIDTAARQCSQSRNHHDFPPLSRPRCIACLSSGRNSSALTTTPRMRHCLTPGSRRATCCRARRPPTFVRPDGRASIATSLSPCATRSMRNMAGLEGRTAARLTT